MIMIVHSFLETKEEELDLKGESFTQMMASAMASLPNPRNAESSCLPLPSSAKERHTGAAAAVAATGVAGTPAVAGAFTPKGGAAKHGVVRSHVARFKRRTPSRFPIPRSPYLSFPPGFNPTTLLDSPVLSTGQQGEPSPTTGTSPLPPICRGSGSAATPASDPVEKSADQDGSRTFVYKPVPNLGRNGLSVHSMAVSKEVPQATPSAPFQDAPNVVASLQMRVPSESIDEPSEKAEPGKPPVQVHPPPVEMSSEDGYNWRKYGQKQVKSSKFPRSYYKCAHPNCPVKKKVERSEVVYKGEHDHPKPQATRRISMGPPQAVNGSSRDGIIAVTLRVDGSYEHITDASSMRGQFPNGSSATTKTSEPSLGSASDDERDGAGGRKPDEGDNDEHNSKRRKKQNAGDAASILPSRTIREPRVVVQTMSDVNILDDGYRWCKYGQKVIKGNPHPRSYYKCHNHGCPVRKHVERSSTDIRAVITTYEGKHNHDAPAAKSSSHDSTGSIVTAVTLPHALNASSAMPITRPTPSLQHQYPMGRLLEDRFKGDDRFDGSNMAGARKLAVCTAFVQPGRSQGVSETSVPTSLSFLNPGVNGRLELQGGESFRQGLVLRPKAEPEEDNRVRVLGFRRRP